MDTLYDIMEKLLPFSWAHYNFMKNALLAILIITPLFGLIGTMVINNKMAFFSDALGHSAFTGIAVGAIFGIANTNLSMVLYATLFALLLNYIKRKRTLSTDTVISVFSSFSMAVGLMILSKGGKFSNYSSLLIGDILSVTLKEVGMLCIVLILTMIYWFLSFNKLNSVGVNISLARSKNIKTNIIEDSFSVLIAIIVMLSIRWVGILIINALLIIPAAASRNISANMREYHIFSIIISMFSGVVGLVLSYYLGTATGPTVVIIASLVFFITFLLGSYKSK
ncbi:MAG: metal ABC transporter permease [Clostridiales bacterium]|nr:metal ABC transporter permease [Clostridiales bacterium]